MSVQNRCEHCSEQWIGQRKGRFCSSNCCHIYKKHKARKLVNLNKSCLECNCSFIAQKVSTKFCGIKCNNKHWFKNNRDKHNFKEAKRRAQQKKATPQWLTDKHWDQIKSIYAGCPKGSHVDHIVPLQGRDVRGLHVPWNLQILTAADNIAKGNKVI